MKKWRKGVVAALVVVGVFAALYGCRKQGPAERAGKEIDRSVVKAGKEIGKAGKKMKRLINDMKKEVGLTPTSPCRAFEPDSAWARG